MDLSSFKMNKTDDSTFKNNYQMRTITQLGHAIDSLREINKNSVKQASHNLALNLQFPSRLDSTGWDAVEKKPAPSRFLLSVDWARDSLRKRWTADRKTQDSIQRITDSVKKAQKDLATAVKGAKPGPATPQTKPSAGSPVTGKSATPPTATSSPSPHITSPAYTPPVAIHPVSKDPPKPTFADIIPDSVRLDVTTKAISIVNQSKVSLYQPVSLFTSGEKTIRQYEIAWHEKITLAIACMVMFIIGAPLGSIIRKGGIGMPLVFAVVFFVIFFLLNNFGKKLAGSAVLSPLEGMWMATYVLTPIGIFLIYKALNDSQLFNKEFYFRLTKKIRPFLARLRKPKPISGGQQPAGAA
jgi:lipopolysaccharide export system permease protein